MEESPLTPKTLTRDHSSMAKGIQHSTIHSLVNNSPSKDNKQSSGNIGESPFRMTHQVVPKNNPHMFINSNDY